METFYTPDGLKEISAVCCSENMDLFKVILRIREDEQSPWCIQLNHAACWFQTTSYEDAVNIASRMAQEWDNEPLWSENINWDADCPF